MSGHVRHVPPHDGRGDDGILCVSEVEDHGVGSVPGGTRPLLNDENQVTPDRTLFRPGGSVLHC